jgi:hypothetical protein
VIFLEIRSIFFLCKFSVILFAGYIYFPKKDLHSIWCYFHKINSLSRFYKKTYLINFNRLNLFISNKKNSWPRFFYLYIIYYAITNHILNILKWYSSVNLSFLSFLLNLFIKWEIFCIYNSYYDKTLTINNNGSIK